MSKLKTINQWSDFNIKPSDDSKNFELLPCPQCCKTTISQITPLYISHIKNNWFCRQCGFCGDLNIGMQKASPKNNIDILNYQPNSDSQELEYFIKKGISRKTLEDLKIGFTENQYNPYDNENPNAKAFIFPYILNNKIVNLVYRRVFTNSAIGGEEIVFNADSINNNETYLTLNEIDALSLHEAGFKSVISLFNTTEKDTSDNDSIEKILDSIAKSEKLFKNIKKIVLALPNNSIAEQLEPELIRRIGITKCWVAKPPIQGTWNDILVNYSPESVASLLSNAKEPKISGIISLQDVSEEIDRLYEIGMERGVSTGYASLDPYYTVVPGQMTIVTGIPGHGKSNILDQIMVNIARSYQWRFAIFSPENQPVARYYSSLMGKYVQKAFGLQHSHRMSKEEKDYAKAWVDRYFSVILPDEDDDSSLKGILKKAETLVFRRGIKGMVIDPWNELDHERPNNLTETEYISKCLTTIRQFGRLHRVHMWIVAHPQKLKKDLDGKYPVPTPYDIAGSAHFRNKADNAVAAWRNAGGPDESILDFHVQKIRYQEVGSLGRVSLRFEKQSGTYIDDVNQDARSHSLQNNLETPTNELLIRS